MLFIAIDDSYRTDWSTAFTNLDWGEFRKYWPLALEAEKPSSEYHVKKGPMRLSEREVEGLTALGVPLKVHPYPDGMVTKLVDAGRTWGYSEAPTPEDIKNGAAVHITIPDNRLLLIDEVCYLDDACTDDLQAHLEQGWRMLAVCPPNAQRRPDYILGRRKPKDDL